MWTTGWAMAVGSVRSMILGVMASPLLLLVTGGSGSSDGTGGAILALLPVLGAMLGFVLGLAIPLLQRSLSRPGRIGMEPATHRTRSLILALIAAAPPALGLAMVSLGWLVCARAANAGGFAREIIGYWSFAAILAAPLGASMAVWALLSVWWTSRKHPDDCGPARLRRKLTVRLALVALVLNGAAPWLFWEGRLLPAGNLYESGSEKPSAVPISRSRDSSNVSPVAPATTPSARPKGNSQPQGAVPAPPSGP